MQLCLVFFWFWVDCWRNIPWSCLLQRIQPDIITACNSAARPCSPPSTGLKQSAQPLSLRGVKSLIMTSSSTSTCQSYHLYQLPPRSSSDSEIFDPIPLHLVSTTERVDNLVKPEAQLPATPPRSRTPDGKGVVENVKRFLKGWCQGTMVEVCKLQLFRASIHTGVGLSRYRDR
jgi:hypothetical protein